jgi:hypothetical protein
MKFLTISSLALALAAIAFAFPGIQTASAAESHNYRASRSEKVPPAAEANSPSGVYNPRASNGDYGAAPNEVSAGGFHAQRPAREPATGLSIGAPMAQARTEGWPNNNQSALDSMYGSTSSAGSSHRAEKPQR